MKDTIRLLIFLIFAIKLSESNKTRTSRYSSGVQEQEILNHLLKNYDRRVRPPAFNSTGKNYKNWHRSRKLKLDPAGPVNVVVNIMIRMLSKIDVVNMEYNLQITFREEWYDPRLAYENLGYSVAPKFLTVPHVKENLWIPDTFFPTEKAAHRHLIDTDNMFIRIHPDGKILYSSRISITNACLMKLKYYPFDVQYCDFDLISYAHTMKDIIYRWDTKGDPVQRKRGVGNDLPNFLLTKILTNNECTSHTNTGSYACLRMTFVLERQISYYMVQLYGPTTMIVIVSWVSFWIDMHSTAGRVALGVTTLLTMTTMQSAINAKLPPVSYIKFVDVWLGACQTFVFGALLEYAFVSYQDSVRQSDRAREESARKAQKRRQKLEMVDAEIYQPPCTCHRFKDEPMTFRDCIRQYFTKPDYLPAQIDYYSRFLVPFAFMLFCIVYWSTCLILAHFYTPD
ncbi:hypothetical protein WR25_04210 isoform C [Diploscapter pachys]|uniref:Ig-like domain-containing protein n=2 Tax=Diploscapter pachys TaxID=2018661 RepID=A0A2A2K1C1_9BILA|nr:hypothetical protein WR25_04210 isoform C [Diploscapter pachys]